MIYASHYIPSFANVTGFIGRGRRRCCHQYQPLASRAVTEKALSTVKQKKKLRLLGEFRGRIEKILNFVMTQKTAEDSSSTESVVRPA